MQVLDKEEKIIPGLYAGGDSAGGWETDSYCMVLAGHALGFAVNSGRIAGEHAAEFFAGKS
jgi:fumarate reductase flavoprotein subunit